MAKYTVYTKNETTSETAEVPARNMAEVREVVSNFIGGGIAAERFVKNEMIIGCEATIAHRTFRYELEG